MIIVTKDAALSFNNDDRYRNIGYAISYFRKRKGLTQEEVAERVGISRQHLGSIEAPNMVRALSLESANKKSSP